MFGVLLKVQASEDGPTKISIGIKIPFGFKVKRFSEFDYNERFNSLKVGTMVKFEFDDTNQYPRLTSMEAEDFDVCFLCESYMETHNAVTECGDCAGLVPKEKVDEVVPLRSASLKSYRYSKGLTLAWSGNRGLRLVTIFESHPWFDEAMSFEIGQTHRIQGWCDKEFDDGNKYITLVECPEQV